MNCQINKEALTVCEVTIGYTPKVKPSQRPVLSTPAAVYKFLLENAVFDPRTVEYKEFFKVLLFNSAGKLLGVSHLSEGGINHATVDIRQLMQTALLANASGMIICHNHPSGNLQPSESDDKITMQIREACTLFNIKLQDHLIISCENYYSYADKGR
jgi:DNA repair protein RadC